MATTSPDDDELVDALWSVARRLRGLGRDALVDAGITPGTVRALTVLLRHGPMRPGQLGEHLRIAARSATEVVDALVDRGLVDRHPDPEDRRATLLVPTDAGERMGETIRALRRAENQKLFAALSATDRKDLARVLRKLGD